MSRNSPVNFSVCAMLFLLLAPGCTIEHHVADDYAHYLVNNEGGATLPFTGLRASYALSDATSQHHLEFRSFMAGHGNLWIVEFGNMLDATLQSTDVQRAFTELRRADTNTPPSNIIITFTLQDYTFEDHHAHVALAVRATSGASLLLEESYAADGASQGGKVFWGGVWAMKNAIQQSTKLAVDEIMGRLLADLIRRTESALVPYPE